MPNRFLKESICTSSDIATLSWQEEVFWYRLIVNCDDYGRFYGDVEILRARCYPKQLSKVTSAVVTKMLDHLEQLDMVRRYVASDEPYVWLPAWPKHQGPPRAKGSKFPQPPTDESGREHLLSDARSVQADARDMRADVTVSRSSVLEVRDSKSDIRVSSFDARAREEDGPRLCELLADLIEGNGAKRPHITQAWLDAARLMLDRDKRDPAEAEHVLRWSQADEFWRSNILSMPKLRERYDQLLLKSRSNGSRREAPAERLMRQRREMGAGAV